MPFEKDAAVELAHYRSIFELAILGAAQLDLKDSRIVWANSTFASILGYTTEEIVGLTLADLTHPEDMPRVNRRIEDIRGGSGAPANVERRYLRKDGSHIWVSIAATIKRDAAGRPTHLIGIMRDISERKRNELELRESEERLNAILGAVQDVVWSFSHTEMRLTYMNASATKRIYRRDVQEFYDDYRVGIEVAHPADRPLVESTLERLVRNGSTEDVYRILWPNGEIRWLDARAWTARGPDGNPLRFEGVIRDITAAKEAEIALRESESRLRLVMELGKIGMWEVDVLTGEAYWSPALKALCGVPEDFPATTEGFWKLVHPEDMAEVMKGNAELMKGRTSFPPFRIIRPDGQIRWLQNIGQVEREGDKLIGVLVDVTEAREAERLIEAQKANIVAASKMSALGEMAAGLAHEINNPVAIIHGHATLLKHVALHGGEPEVIKKTAEVVAQTADRISKITRSLLAFARDAGQDPFELASLKSVIDDTAEFCRQRFRKYGVELTIDPVSPDLRVECRPVQVSQVLLNLLNNAFDAVEKSPRQQIHIAVKDLGGKVEISVKDSGPGIPAALRERIFQPFFTTKEVGRGTGLGLSVASGLIQAHAGRLAFESSGEGTRFVITLPKKQ